MHRGVQSDLTALGNEKTEYIKDKVKALMT